MSARFAIETSSNFYQYVRCSCSSGVKVVVLGVKVAGLIMKIYMSVHVLEQETKTLK